MCPIIIGIIPTQFGQQEIEKTCQLWNFEIYLKFHQVIKYWFDILNFSCKTYGLLLYKQTDVTEEYRLYDTESFIADIGGYLGLLLGASLLSVIEETLELLQNNCCGYHQTNINSCPSEFGTSEETDKKRDK